jgi:RNA polymerase sigma-70 factor (ECF subfamily)
VWGQSEAETGIADAELVAQLQRGDAEAFRLLVERHSRALYRTAWRLSRGHRDCEDWVQEAFLRLWRRPSSLRDGAAVKGWLMRTVSNLVIDSLRKAPQVAIDEIAEPEAPPTGEAARASVAQTVDAAIAALPERQRMALVFVYYENMSNIEAAAAMEISVEAVESLLARARRSLRASLAEMRGGLFDDLRELNG